MSNHMSASIVLECSGLQKTFGDNAAVGDVGFHIDAGETYDKAKWFFTKLGLGQTDESDSETIYKLFKAGKRLPKDSPPNP